MRRTLFVTVATLALMSTPAASEAQATAARPCPAGTVCDRVEDRRDRREDRRDVREDVRDRAEDRRERRRDRAPRKP